ncbi:SDR family oxidoreductase [Candidatus Woesearchaeota archaeon]|nr:SDR family oxidoreductase [Candidatus Woesearchaeota archaeon]
MPFLKHKTALVTGSAVRTGRAIALCLAENGADVIVHYDKSKAQADEVTEKIKSIGKKSISLKADLMKVDEVENMFKQVIKKFKKIDILVNNVGNFLVKDISKVTYEEWNYLIDTTLNTTFYCCKACLPYMRKRNFGRIINMADSEADRIIANTRITPYKIGKVGVLILTKTLAVSEAKYDITVNAISPGVIDNSISKPLLSEIPKGRYANYNDINNAVLFLLKPQSSYITGANIKVSGGYNL